MRATRSSAPGATARPRSWRRRARGGARRRTGPSWMNDSLAATLLATPALPDDQLVGCLVLLAGALPERRDAPWGDRVSAALRLALAAAVRVVDGVHRGAADGGALADPAAAPGLAAGLVGVIGVADLAHGRAADEEHAAHLARGETQHGVVAVLRDELDARAGRTSHLAALARLELDVVDERAGRDVREREAVARL